MQTKLNFFFCIFLNPLRLFFYLKFRSPCKKLAHMSFQNLTPAWVRLFRTIQLRYQTSTKEQAFSISNVILVKIWDVKVTMYSSDAPIQVIRFALFKNWLNLFCSFKLWSGQCVVLGSVYKHAFLWFLSFYLILNTTYTIFYNAHKKSGHLGYSFETLCISQCTFVSIFSYNFSLFENIYIFLYVFTFFYNLCIVLFTYDTG